MSSLTSFLCDVSQKEFHKILWERKETVVRKSGVKISTENNVKQVVILQDFVESITYWIVALLLNHVLIKKQRYHFANKGPCSQSYGFSSRHVWMWELNHQEDWVPKNWCLWTVVLEKTLGSLSDCKEIKPVNPKGNQPWIFTGSLLLKLNLQYVGHQMRKANLFDKTLMLGKIEGKRRRAPLEDEMVR